MKAKVNTKTRMISDTLSKRYTFHVFVTILFLFCLKMCCDFEVHVSKSQEDAPDSSALQNAAAHPEELDFQSASEGDD